MNFGTSRLTRMRTAPILLLTGQQLFHAVNMTFCYIASVNTKRDWLICSHVALDKCNVSRPGNK